MNGIKHFFCESFRISFELINFDLKLKYDFGSSVKVQRLVGKKAHSHFPKLIKCEKGSQIAVLGKTFLKVELLRVESCTDRP